MITSNGKCLWRNLGVESVAIRGARWLAVPDILIATKLHFLPPERVKTIRAWRAAGPMRGGMPSWIREVDAARFILVSKSRKGSVKTFRRQIIRHMPKALIEAALCGA